MPPHRIGTNKCILNEDRNIFTIIGTGNRHTSTYVIFLKPWMSGIHEMAFKCINDEKRAISIGVLTNPNAHPKIWLFDDSSAGITYQLYSYKKEDDFGIYHFSHGIRKGQTYHKKSNTLFIHDGDIISMKMDFNEATIGFYVNGEEHGTVSFDRYRKYYPALSCNCHEHTNYNPHYQLVKRHHLEGEVPKLKVSYRV